mmetsp:Transcript_50911/g.136993  ORF Transcript_50911/g.136993 Transcript_50911/m.136993 type:complete len:221 (-) Transcript_50911:39-701(-)
MVLRPPSHLLDVQGLPVPLGHHGLRLFYHRSGHDAQADSGVPAVPDGRRRGRQRHHAVLGLVRQVLRVLPREVRESHDGPGLRQRRHQRPQLVRGRGQDGRAAREVPRADADGQDGQRRAEGARLPARAVDVGGGILRDGAEGRSWGNMRPRGGVQLGAHHQDGRRRLRRVPHRPVHVRDAGQRALQRAARSGVAPRRDEPDAEGPEDGQGRGDVLVVPR